MSRSLLESDPITWFVILAASSWSKWRNSPIQNRGRLADIPRRLRYEKRRARNQLRGCKYLPSGIVVYSDSMWQSVTPETVASAAFGPGFVDARRHDRVEVYTPAFRF